MTSNNNLYDKIVLPAVNTLTSNMTKMYKGFSTVSANTENYNLYDFELIKQDLLNHFYVRQGERLMNPTYGTIIWDVLFEPLTDELKTAILQNVNQIFDSDPRVQVNNIVITPYDTGLQIQCELTYLLYNIQQQLQIQFDQNIGLIS